MSIKGKVVTFLTGKLPDMDTRDYAWLRRGWESCGEWVGSPYGVAFENFSSGGNEYFAPDEGRREVYDLLRRIESGGTINRIEGEKVVTFAREKRFSELEHIITRRFGLSFPDEGQAYLDRKREEATAAEQ